MLFAAFVVALLSLAPVTARDRSSHGVVRAEGKAVRFAQAFTDDDGIVDDASLDGADTGVDPGSTWDTGRCMAAVDAEGNANIALSNAYPGYACRIWLRASNDGEAAIAASEPTMSAPTELLLSRVAPGWQSLAPGESGLLEYRVEIGPAAEPDHTYGFSIVQGFVAAE